MSSLVTKYMLWETYMKIKWDFVLSIYQSWYLSLHHNILLTPQNIKWLEENVNCLVWYQSETRLIYNYAPANWDGLGVIVFMLLKLYWFDNSCKVKVAPSMICAFL